MSISLNFSFAIIFRIKFLSIIIIVLIDQQFYPVASMADNAGSTHPKLVFFMIECVGLGYLLSSTVDSFSGG